MINKRELNARYQTLSASQTEDSAQTYTVNWAAELDTDTISTSTWTAEDSGLIIANESNTTQSASARLSGDTGRYRIINKIVTTAGDTMERYIDLIIMENDLYYSTDWGYYNYR